jgi:hypothetical protein
MQVAWYGRVEFIARTFLNALCAHRIAGIAGRQSQPVLLVVVLAGVLAVVLAFATEH